MATSISRSRRRSIGSAPEDRRIVMSGWSRMNCGRRGPSHLAAKLGALCSASTCAAGARLTSSQAASITSNTRARLCCRRAPSGVVSTARWRRVSSRRPTCSSSSRTWWLIADCVRCSSSAARVKLLSRAVASKALSSTKFGILLMHASRYERDSCLYEQPSFVNASSGAEHEGIGPGPCRFFQSRSLKEAVPCPRSQNVPPNRS